MKTMTTSWGRHMGGTTRNSGDARIRVRAGSVLLAGLLCGSMGSVHAATFLTTSGGTKSTFKGIATNTNLECDLAGLKVDATTAVTPTLVLGGAAGSDIFCKEISIETGAVTDTGWFTLKQTALNNCLSVDSTSVPGQTTWTCKVPTGRNSARARWIIQPTAQYQAQFCAGIPDPNTATAVNEACYAEHGTPDGARARDFPARDVNGGVLGDAVDDLADGEVLRFTAPGGRLLFGPCHSGSFEGGSPVLCEQRVQGTSYRTRTDGTAETVYVVGIDISPTINMSNSSESSTLPTTVYGSADFSVRNVDTSSFTLFGPFGAANVTASAFSYSDQGTLDGYEDLRIGFDRLKFIEAIKTVTGLCPSSQTDVTLSLRGAYVSSGKIGKWQGTDTVVIGNCSP